MLVVNMLMSGFNIIYIYINIIIYSHDHILLNKIMVCVLILCQTE